MAETLTPPPIQNAIAEQPGLLTPRVWSRYFAAIRDQVLALVTWQDTLLATTPPPTVAATSATGTAETAARGDHTHGSTGEQPLDATLTTIAALTGTANQMLYFTGTDVAALTALSAYARTLLDDGDAATMRGTLLLGTMAQQNATAVAITGGTCTSMTSLSGTDVFATHLEVTRMDTGIPIAGARIALSVGRTTYDGIYIRPDADTGPQVPLRLLNTAGGQVGYIDTTATGTVFGTTSDVRLKHAIITLPGALDRIRALNPVAFRWNANDELDHGFLAHELMQVIPAAVTGEPDAVDDAGNIQPQGVDHSKIVPHLTAALQELAAQVETLTARLDARVTALEAAP